MKKTEKPKAPLKFEIEGEGELSHSSTPQLVSTFISILDALPDGKLLKRGALAARTSRSPHTVLQNAAHPALNDYKFIHGRSAYFGNKRTIAAARKEFAL